MKNEDDTKAGVKVLWKGVRYTTGNRKHDQVELYCDGVFVRTVRISEIRKA